LLAPWAFPIFCVVSFLFSLICTSSSCDALQIFTIFLNIVQIDRFFNLAQSDHGINGRCMKTMFLQMMKHAYWFDSLVAPNFDNVTTSSIFIGGIISLNFVNHSYIRRIQISTWIILWSKKGWKVLITTLRHSKKRTC
jgi:hypothetical protein